MLKKSESVKYFTANTEKEWREKGKNAADKIYKSIFSKVKEKQKKVSVVTCNKLKNLEIIAEQTDNESAKYKRKIAERSKKCQSKSARRTEIDDANEEFFKIEFERQSLEWQKKIRGTIAGIVHLIKTSKLFKSCGKENLNYISVSIGNAIKKYSEILEQYNTLKEMKD